MLEISLSQNGVDISSLSAQYNHGEISQQAYIKRLRDLAVALGDTKDVADTHKKTIAEIVAENMALSKAAEAAAAAETRLFKAFQDAGLAGKLDWEAAIQNVHLMQQQMDLGNISASQFAQGLINLSTAVEKLKQWNVAPIKQSEFDLADALVTMKD